MGGIPDRRCTESTKRKFREAYSKHGPEVSSVLRPVMLKRLDKLVGNRQSNVGGQVIQEGDLVGDYLLGRLAA